MSESKPVVNAVYEHINNGGVSFAVTDVNGPTIEIEASHFGNRTNSISLHVTKEALLNLAEMFTAAAKLDYSEDYACVTTSKIIDKDTGKMIGVGNGSGDYQFKS